MYSRKIKQPIKSFLEHITIISNLALLWSTYFQVTNGNRHDRGASHQSEEVHDKFVIVLYPTQGYIIHAPPSNSFPPSHVSLFRVVYHRKQHR